MYPLNRLTELVRKDDNISLNFKRTESGIQIVITPSLKDVADSESDENKRTLYAALARPYVVTVVDGESVEDALNRAFDVIAQPRIDTVAAHDAYVAALKEAAEVAKKAADAKLKASAAKQKSLATSKDTKSTKPAAPTSPKPEPKPATVAASPEPEEGANEPAPPAATASEAKQAAPSSDALVAGALDEVAVEIADHDAANAVTAPAPASSFALF